MSLLVCHLRGLEGALGLLSVLPVGSHAHHRAPVGYALAHYPSVGALLGLLVWGASELLALWWPIVLERVIALALLVVLTGGLHWDGVIDTLDGWFSRLPADAALRIMRDPGVGALGVVHGVLLLAVQGVAVVTLPSLALLPGILALSRLGALWAIARYPYVGGGMGASLREALSPSLLAFACAVALGVAVASLGAMGVLVAVVAMGLVGWLVARALVARFEGLSGDMYGALIVASESAGLVALCAWH